MQYTCWLGDSYLQDRSPGVDGDFKNNKTNQNTPSNFPSCLFFSFPPLIFCFSFWLNCVWIGIYHLPHFFQQIGLIVYTCGRYFFCKSRKKDVSSSSSACLYVHPSPLFLPTVATHGGLISPNSDSWKSFSGIEWAQWITVTQDPGVSLQVFRLCQDA